MLRFCSLLQVWVYFYPLGVKMVVGYVFPAKKVGPAGVFKTVVK